MKPIEMDRRSLIMIGAGGHAKVLHALAVAAGHSIIGVCDPHLAQKCQTHWRGIPVLGGDEVLEKVDPSAVGLINGIGQQVWGGSRREVYCRLRQAGFTFPVMVHPTACVAPSAELADGVQVMAGAVVQPDCRLGKNTIINTRASVDHDCHVGADVHLAPGVTVCGSVDIHDQVFIGAGATIIQNLSIGHGSVVAAGVTLLRNLEAGKIIRHTAGLAEQLKSNSH